MSAERRRLSVTITGPEHDLREAMAELLRREGYVVIGRGDPRVAVTRRSRMVLTALGGVTDGQLAALARSWRFARLEVERRLAEPDDDT